MTDRKATPMVPAHAGQIVVLALLLTVLVYLPGLFGGFLFDDFPNIVSNSALRNLDGSPFRWLSLALSSNAGLLRRPISMLSFGVDFTLFGLSPLAFKLTNLVLHLGNGLLLLALARRLVPHLLPVGSTSANANAAGGLQRAVPLLVMAVWLVHPLHVSGVIYIVQRMNELAVLFTLAGLLCYVAGRARQLNGERGFTVALGGLVLFGILAVLSKENGALIVAYALVIEAICFRFQASRASQRRLLLGFFVLTVAVPIALFLGYLATHPQWLAGAYAGRDFTLYQRLLSEPRILCDYLLWILLPLPRWMGVYHDDILTSTSLLQPISTLPAIVLLLLLVMLAWRWRRRVPGFSFAVAWFLIGHSMESTFLPLELVFDHRNYLPTAGLSLGLVCAITPWLRARLKPQLITGASVALVLALAATTATWAYAWGDPLRLALTEATSHPDSARAQYEAGRRIIFQGTANGERDQAEQQAIPYFERAKALDPTDMYAASALIIIHSRHGQHPPADAITDLARRVRHMRQVRINPFLNLMTGAVQGDVQLTVPQMRLLAESALDNPRLNDGVRAMVLNNYGHYMFQIAHDNQAAVSLTLAAAAQDPTNPLFELNLTRLALAIGDVEMARQHLLKTEQLDRAKLYGQTIAALKEQTGLSNKATQ